MHEKIVLSMMLICGIAVILYAQVMHRKFDREERAAQKPPAPIDKETAELIALGKHVKSLGDGYCIIRFGSALVTRKYERDPTT